jgi:hypothetical protein
VKTFFLALLLTEIIEIIIAIILGYKDLKVIVGVFLINLITNPLLNYFLKLNATYLFISTTFTNLIILEIFVSIIEGIFLYYLLNRQAKPAIFLSITMNFGSFLIGRFAFYLLGYM